MATDDDMELAQRVGRGDARAAAAFGRRLTPRVRQLARSLMGAREGWEDAAQLSLMELLRAAPSYGGTGSLERWSDRITVRTTLRYARARRALSHSEGGHEPDELVAPPAPDPVTRNEVAELLGDLDPARRTVIVLRHVYEYGIDEIASMTGVSRNTVKDRLVQARRTLRQRLRRKEGRQMLRLVSGGGEG